MKIRIHDVKGDGSCFYRCVWRLARADRGITRDLVLDPEDLEDEDLGVREIRRAVAWYVENDSDIVDRLEDLAELYATAGNEWLLGVYPILGSVDPRATLVENFEAVARTIRSTDTYASEFELEIVRRALEDADVLVLACESFDDLAHLGDKWMRELHAMLAKVTKKKVGVLVNEGNFHYRLLSFSGRAVVNARDLKCHIDEKMLEPSDGE